MTTPTLTEFIDILNENPAEAQKVLKDLEELIRLCATAIKVKTMLEKSP
jgi:hypothetical protein